MHLLSTKQVTSPSQLDSLFNQADFMRNPWQYGVDPVALARGLVLAIVKDEGSTRTRVSFEVAMKRLGGEVVLLELDNNSSISKGETVEDTVRTLSEYVDAIVMRHSQKGMVQHCSKFSNVPVINAGDGDGEHPTQALLDVYTIKREVGRLQDLTVMFVGDLRCSRTVHSLIHLLSLYPNNRYYLISPEDMRLPEEYKPAGMNYIEHHELNDAIKNIGGSVDVLYMTRLQRERYMSKEEVMECLSKRQSPFRGDWESLHKKSGGSYYVLDATDLNEECPVLHPLPRNGEIPVEFDSDKRAAYFRQAKNGMYIRMALLNSLFRSQDFFGRALTNA